MKQDMVLRLQIGTTLLNLPTNKKQELKIYTKMTKLEETLILCCRELNLRMEPAMVVIVCCRTEKQQLAMLRWIKNHYQENPSESEILRVAEEIMEKVKD